MSDVYIPPLEREAWTGPGAYPKPHPIRGVLKSITDAEDGTLDIEVEANDGKLHRFSGCYIYEYSSYVSAAALDVVVLENVSLISSARNAPPIQVRRMKLPSKMLHGANGKICPNPIEIPLAPGGEPNKNGDIITLTEEQIRDAKFNLLEMVEHLNKPRDFYSMGSKTGEVHMTGPPTYVGEISPRQDLPVETKRSMEPVQDRERRANYVHHVALDEARRVLMTAMHEVYALEGGGAEFSPRIKVFSTLLNFLIANLDYVKKEGMR